MSDLRLMEAKEVRDLTRLPLSRIYELCRRGSIPHVRIEGRLYFREASIRDWMDAKEAEMA